MYNSDSKRTEACFCKLATFFMGYCSDSLHAKAQQTLKTMQKSGQESIVYQNGWVRMRDRTVAI